MKFPRRAKLLRNPLDATAYAGVFFLLVLFVAFGSRLYTPGVKIVLPTADNLPGTDKPTVTVAMDQSGRFYFQNQIVEESALKIQLLNIVVHATEPLVLVIQADKNVRHADLLKLALLARDAGITESLLATLPRAVAAPARP
jgi:biopolymer transport protein ExbD